MSFFLFFVIFLLTIFKCTLLGCWSYDNSVFSFLRKLHTVLHSDFTTLLSYQWCRRGFQFFSYPCQDLLFSVVVVVFYIVATLIGMRWCLTMLSTCTSLMINDIKHLFICLLAICISFLRNVYSCPLPSFKLGYLIFCCWVIGVLYIFCTLPLYQIYDFLFFPAIP